MHGEVLKLKNLKKIARFTIHYITVTLPVTSSVIKVWTSYILAFDKETAFTYF
ncbi:MAG: hypothetical protein NVSMB7_09800 [Chitinophagaceae bacterium]